MSTPEINERTEGLKRSVAQSPLLEQFVTDLAGVMKARRVQRILALFYTPDTTMESARGHIAGMTEVETFIAQLTGGQNADR
jgi:hypothetical protein